MSGTSFSYSTFGGICVSQINHFLTLYWSPGYEERVTTDTALKATAGMKAGLCVVILTGLMIDPHSSDCSSNPVPVCNLLNPENYFWQMVPILMVVLVTVSVTVYVVKIILKLQRSVAPVVNLPVPTVSKRVETKQARSLEGSEQSKTANHPQQAVSNHEDEINVIDIEYEPKNEENTETVTETRRINSDPNMFFKVKEQRRNDEQVPPVCFPSPVQLSTAWKILNVNLLSLCTLLLYLPLSTVFTYIFISGRTCDEILVPSILTGVSNMIFNVLYLMLVHRKLNKFSN